MIDVGANIGDTVVFTNHQDGKFLLIEGEKKYNRLILANLMQNGFKNQNNILIENTFIGDCFGCFSNVLQDGSGSLRATDSQRNGIKIQTLDHIVQKHSFQPNFIKIDTDGFDFKVIRSAINTLKEFSPILFFEWDKFFLEEQNEDPLSIFDFLGNCGYETIFIFDNYGTLLCKEKNSNKDNLKRFLAYTEKSKKNIYYFDLLVLHKTHRNIDFESYLC